MQKGQLLDAQKVGDKRIIRVPDSVMEKLDIKVGDFLSFYYDKGNVVIYKSEIT